jgi:nucleoside-diphosphate-sugar epimerase
MTEILVTGGGGFIGSHLAGVVMDRNGSVRVLDNFSTGKPENLAGIRGNIQLIEDDIRDLSACVSACRGVDTVYHLAALGSVPRSVEDPLTTNAVNVNGTLNMLRAAQECGVRRFVFSSSSSVYGDTPTLPKDESMRPSPKSPYAVTKLAGEEYCRAFARTYGVETVALRYFNVFGPRQDPNSQYAAVIPRFLSALYSAQAPVIYGDGKQSRDFTYVRNVVEANLLAGSAAGVSGEVFNIACADQVTVRDVLDLAAELMGVSIPPTLLPPRAGDIVHSRADISHAQSRLGYKPVVNFNTGLSLTVHAFLHGAVAAK